jgi:hypothetical protein
MPYREVNTTGSLCGSIVHNRILLLRKYSTDVDKTDKKLNLVKQVYSSPNHISSALCREIGGTPEVRS